MQPFIRIVQASRDNQPQQQALKKWRRPKGLKRLLLRAVRLPRKLIWALFLEGVETKQMIYTYARQGRGKLLVRMNHDMPSEEELQQAREQLRDLPKFLPFFILVVVPLPGVTESYALVAITLENWLGSKWSLLPSQFRKVFENKDEGLP